MQRGQVKNTILKALESGEKYGWEIIKEIERLSNGKIIMKQPSLYSALSRLEIAGLVTSYWVDSTIGGKRHYYKLVNKNEKNISEIESVVKPSEDIVLNENNQFQHEEQKNEIIDVQTNENKEQKNEIIDVQTNENKEQKNEIIDVQTNENKEQITNDLKTNKNQTTEKFFGIKVQENQENIFSILEKNTEDIVNKDKKSENVNNLINNDTIKEEIKSENDYEEIFNSIKQPQKSFLQRDLSPVKKLVPTDNLEESNLLYGNFELKNELEQTFENFINDGNENLNTQNDNIDIKNIFKEFLNDDERIDENPLHNNIEEKPIQIKNEDIQSAFISQPINLDNLNNVNISLTPKTKEQNFYNKKTIITNEEIPTLNSSFKFQASKKVETKLKGLILKEHKKINNKNYNSKLFNFYKYNLISLLFCLFIAIAGILTTYLISKNLNGVYITTIFLTIAIAICLVISQLSNAKKTYKKYNFKQNILWCSLLILIFLSVQTPLVFIYFNGSLIVAYYFLILNSAIILFPFVKLILYKYVKKRKS